MASIHFRAVLEGTIGGGTDIWSMGFGVRGLTGDADSVLQTAVDDVYSAFDTLLWEGTGFSGSISNTTTFDRARLFEYDAAGHVSRSFVSSIQTAVPGGSSNKSLPSEVAVCVSLVTPLAGASHRGRCYFPALTVNTVATNGLLASAVRDDLATRMQAVFNNLRHLAHPVLPTVYSIKTDDDTEITALRVGNVFDSQRRRRNSIVEAYVNKALTP